MWQGVNTFWILFKFEYQFCRKTYDKFRVRKYIFIPFTLYKILLAKITVKFVLLRGIVTPFSQSNLSFFKRMKLFSYLFNQWRPTRESHHKCEHLSKVFMFSLSNFLKYYKIAGFSFKNSIIIHVKTDDH